MSKKLYYWRKVVGYLELFKPYHDQIKELLAGNYRALHLEKLRIQGDYPIYSIRINSERGTRILFTVFEGKICLLEVVHNHDYHKSRTFRCSNPLNGIDVDKVHDADAISTIDGFVADGKVELEEAVPLEFHQKKFICFNSNQIEAKNTTLPAIVYGPAGSGKTLVALSMLSNFVHRHCEEAIRVVYVSRSSYLVDEMRRSWQLLAISDEQLIPKVFFKTYDDVLEEELRVSGLVRADDTEKFDDWYDKRQSRKGLAQNPLKLSAKEVWQEFRIRSGYSQEEYYKLGARQSVLNREERSVIDDLYIGYVKYLASQNMVSSELYTLKTEAPYSLVVVDEAQDLSFGQLSSLKNIAHEDSVVFFLGDHQILFDGKSRFPYLREMLSSFGAGSTISEIKLPGTYRCSTHVIEMANKLVTLKYRVTGGASDKVEEHELVAAKDAALSVGESSFVQPDDKASLGALKELAKRPNVAVITFDEYIDEAKEALETELIFTPTEAKGLEYDTVVVWRPLDKDQCKQACKKLLDASEDIGKNRAKNGKGDDSFLSYFNELITAVTRAKVHVVLVQKCTHAIEHVYNALYQEGAGRKHATEAQQSLPQFYLAEQPSVKESEWEAQVIDMLKRGLEKQAHAIYTKTLKHTSAEFQMLKKLWQQEPVNLTEVSATASPKAVPSSEAPGSEIKQTEPVASASASISKIKVRRQDERRQENISELIAAFEKMDETVAVRLKVNLRIHEPDSFLSTPITANDSQTKNKTLLDYISSKIEYTNLFVQCALDESFVVKSLVGPNGQQVLNSIIKKSKQQSSDITTAFQDLLLILKNVKKKQIRSFSLFDSIIHAAASDGLKNIMEILLKYKVNPDKIEHNGLTPMLLAADKGHSEVVRMLCVAGAKPDIKRPEDGITPVIIAAGFGHAEVIKILHHFNANIALQRHDGETAVFMAAQEQRLDALKVLLELGANPDTPRSTDGATPISIATELGYQEVVERLCQAGANVNTQRSPSGRTPVWLAASNGHEKIVELLHKANAELNTKDFKGMTPLFIATARGRLSVVKYLINANVPIEACVFEGDEFLLGLCGVLDSRERMELIIKKCQKDDKKIELLPKDIAWVMFRSRITKLLEEHDISRPITRPNFFATTPKPEEKDITSVPQNGR